MTEGRIAAVVVTRNRIELLQRCVAHLLQQTRPLDAIYVVDNGSTDGTVELISSDQLPVIPMIHQKNAGGAGGQYLGLKRAYDDGFDWVWTMDDDGYPAQEALASLCQKMKECDARWSNSLVINPEKPDQITLADAFRPRRPLHGNPSVRISAGIRGSESI